MFGFEFVFVSLRDVPVMFVNNRKLIAQSTRINLVRRSAPL